MTHKNVHSVVLATLVILSTALVGVFAVPATIGAADAHSSSTYHDPKANYTFSPDSHEPGLDNGAANHFAVGLEKNLTALHTIVVQSDDFNFADCSADKTEAFGIDRDNDDPGTQTDESLLTKYKSIDFRAHKIVVKFNKKSGLAGDTVALNTDDQIVARGRGCYDNPDKKGWYQVTGTLNGSTNQNTDTDYGITVKTHYIYICDCNSREEAVNKLGPPPSQQGGDGGSGGSSTATPTAKPTETSGGGGGGGGGGGSATATPTPQPTEKSGGGNAQSTATPTKSGGGGGNASTGNATTATAAGTNDTSGNGTAGTNQTASGSSSTNGSSGTVAGGSGGGSGGSSNGPTTPTSSGSGPGFGLLTALGALAAGGLLFWRRDD